MTKTVKKILSLLLAAVIIFGTTALGIPGLLSVSASALDYYSATAAAIYAQTWWNGRNTQIWSDYDLYGGDCANFVAQCLYAGGIPMTPSWYFHMRTGRNEKALSTERTESFTMVNGVPGHTTEHNRSLYRYLLSLGGTLIKNPGASDIAVGDVIFYDWQGDGRYDHVGICAEIKNGVPIIACHYNDRYTSNWKMGADTKNIAIIKLYGSSCTNSAPSYDAYRVTANSLILRSGPSTGSSSKGVAARANYIIHVTQTAKDSYGYTWGKCKVKGVEGWLKLTGYASYITHVEQIKVSHDMGEWYTVTKATCVDHGFDRRDCNRCDYYEERITECGGHKEVKPATCLDASYCSACGAMVSGPLGHNYGNWQTHIAATCTEGGQDKHICTRCGHTEYRDSAPLGHDYVPQVKLPYCETAGETIYTCSRCKDSYTDRSEWSAWIEFDASQLSKYPDDVYQSKTQYRKSTKYITYTEWTTTPIENGNGYVVETKTEGGSYLWGYNLDFYCTRTSGGTRHFRTESINGQYSAYGVSSTYGEHHLREEHGDVLVSVETLATLQQVQPGEKLNASQGGINKSNQVAYAYEYNPGLGYVGPCFIESEVWKDNTTVYYRKAITNWTDYDSWTDTPISANDETRVQTRTLYRFKQAALNHDDVISHIERTCYVDGCTRCTCQRCGRTFDTEIVAKGNHVTMGQWYEWTPDTINDPNIIFYRRDCKTTPGCDYYEIKSVIITRKVVEPNCTEEGYTLVTITDEESGEVIGKYEEDGSRVPALGHDMGEFIMIKAPSCTEEGQKEAVCQREGCNHKEYEVIDPLGHIEVIDPAVAPKCTVTGLTEGSHCTRCDGVVVAQQIVDPTGHNMGEWVNIEPASCNGMGYDRRYCQNTGCDYYEERYLEGLDHNFVVTNKVDATCTTPGYIDEECSRCHLHNSTPTQEPLGHLKGEEYTVYPTCLEDGYKGWDCQRDGCDHSEITENLLATDHNFAEDEHNCNCTNGGYTVYTCTNVNQNTGEACGYTYNDAYTDPLGHEMGEWVVVTAATCDTPGMEKRDCIRGDFSETRVIDPIGHNYKPTVTPPDCTNNGGTVYVCQNDSDHTYYDGIIPALGHDWGEWQTVVEPGCVTEGVKKHICNRDSSHEETERIPAKGHTPVTDNGKDPNCLDDGLTEGSHCSTCNQEIVKQETIPALDHDWGEWVIVAPTCTEDGYKKRVCNRDVSHVEEETLKSDGHATEIIPAVNPTCTETGLTEGLLCTTCKDVLVAQEVVPELGHDWGEWQTIDAPTCVVEGSEHRVCKRDASHVEYNEISPNPHNVVIDAGYSATCTETGLTEGSHCEDCNKVLVAQEIIPELGHDWGEWSRVEPTCTENGHEKRVCARDASHVETVEVPSPGHVPVTDEAVPATCLETGLTEGSHCSVCNEVLVAQEVVPELGHDWGNWQTVTPPGCSAEGEQKRICNRDSAHVEHGKTPALGHTVVIDPAVSPTCLESGKTAGSHCDVCKEVIDESEYIAPLGHDWGEWDIKEANCTEDGYEKRICNRDASHVEEITKKATGHMTETVRGKAPTCTETGLTDGSVCTTCSETLVAQEVIPELGHDWDEWVIIESTCVSVGSKVRTCKRDASHVEEEIVPGPLPHTAVIDPGYSATCTETGLTEGSHCDYCGEVLVAQEVIPELGHDWGEWEVKDASCTEDGYKERVCNRDSSHIEHEDFIHEGHVVVVDPAVPATCLETGLTEGSHCSTCNEVIVAQTVVPELGHDWGDWKTITEPGCLTKGEKKCVCNRDESHVMVEEIPAKGHTVADEDAVDATCLESGKTAGSHCSVCNAVIEKSEYIAPLGHDWGDWVIVNPTCTKDGYKERVCKRDASHVEHEVIKANGHAPEAVPAVEATCLETGLTEGSVCSVCKETLVAQEVIPELGHDWGDWEEINSECAKDGSRKRVCNRDASHIEEEIIPSLGHKVVTDEGKAPTCLETGLTEGSHCSTCNEVLVAQEVIPELGHDWGEWDIKEATCTENGYKNRVCNRDASHTEGEILYAEGHVEQVDTGYSATCLETGLTDGSHCSTCNEVLVAQEVIPALDHDWAEWHTVSKPDCLNDGKKERICNRDSSHVETEDIPALGHTVVIDPAVAPTCTESGLTAGSHCSACDGVIEKQEGIEALGHEMGEWYVVTPADYGVEGLEQCDCVRGDKSETRPIPALVKNKYTATFVIGGEVIAEVVFEEGAKSIEEPKMPEKDNYYGYWEDYELGSEDIVINGYYDLIDPDKISDIEPEKKAEYENGIAKITLKAQADTKAVNVLSKKVKPVDVVLVLDQSGSMTETLGSGTKLEALVEAANTFVNDIYDNAVKTGADHRVAVVGFAYENDDRYGGNFENTEILSTVNGVPVKYSDTLSDSVYKNALMPIVASDGVINPIITKGVNSLEAEGATAANYGLKMAYNILSENKENAENRERIVVFITDGVPTSWGEQYSKIKRVSNSAVLAAQKIKNEQNAKIYSVGVHPDVDPEAEFVNGIDSNGCYNINTSKDTASFDFNRFLHYVSSNYPDATAMTVSGTGNKDGGYYLAVNDTEKLNSIFDGILYSSIYTVTTFDKVTLADTVSADFTMTMEQEEAFRKQLAEEKGLGDKDITITRNADGTTTVRVENVKAEKAYYDDGRAYYKAEISFEVTANENALEAGEYKTNTDDAGIIINGEKVESFEIPTVIIAEPRNIVVFTINGNVYRIEEGNIGDSITVPESDLAKWNIPEDAVITGSYMEFEASEICSDEYTVTWYIGEETIVTKHAVGTVIEPVSVTPPDGYVFAGWSPALRNTMPARNLVYTATFKTAHEHSFVAVSYGGDCESGIITYYECDSCDETKTSTAPATEHEYTAVINDTNNTTIEKVVCSKCGHARGGSVTYRCSYEAGWGRTVELKLYEENVQVQLEDGKIAIMVPIDEKLQNRSFKVYRIDENGKKYSVECKKSNGYLIFYADHFSIFNIVALDEETALPEIDLNYEQSVCSLNGHKIETETDAPTCENDGYTKYTCTLCGYFAYDNEIPATGHTYKDTTVLPDCVSGGYVEHVCENCGHTFKDAETEALGHDLAADKKLPSCTVDGYTVYECSRCDYSVVEDKVESTGHKYKSTVVAATCTSAGYTLYECENCNTNYIGEHVDPAGHKYVDTTVTATCTGEGYVSHVCSVCKYTYVDSTVAAAGHDYEATVVAATCTQGGHTVNKCKDCGYSYTSNKTAATGHTASGEWIIKDGKHVQLCVNCNAVAESKDISINTGNTEGTGLNFVVYYKMPKQLEIIASEGSVVYESADPNIVRVDENGLVTGVKRGSTEITATIEGSDVSVTCKVEVRFTWWQWFIWIFLLGFIWY